MIHLPEHETASAMWRVFPRALKVPLDPREVEEFGAQFGTVSTRDGGRGAWPIAPSKVSGTFSETSGEARLHTDAQYHEQPESAFILACERPALDGGDNLLLEAADARRVAESCFGTDGIALLEAAQWCWTVPKVFYVNGNPQVSPEAPIFGRDGSVRWRIDNIRCRTAQDRDLAIEFADALESYGRLTRLRLEPGDVLLCDNYYALHGRTPFSDPKRLLYRVRLV